MFQMDRLLSMEIFVKSVECGSFSAAADALQMSSQLVGKHIKLLEQQLGVQLLQRTTRRHHLTDIGRAFYDRAKIILTEVEIAENLAAEVRVIPSGKLKISAPVTFGINAFTAKLQQYMSSHPQVSVELSVTNRKVDVIEEGFDAVFRVGQITENGLVARELAPYKLILCASPDYLKQHAQINHPTDLQHHECLSFSHTELRSHWTFNGPHGPITVPISSRLMVDSGEALLVSALLGQGVLLQPSELVRHEIEKGRLVALLPDYPVPTRPMHLLYAPDRRMTPKLRSFIHFVLTHFGPQVVDDAAVFAN
jgi:DNA-binding transcriptional LysR family regulator